MREFLAAFRDVRYPRNVGLISLSHGVNEFYTLVLPPIIPLLVADLSITYAQAGVLLTVFFVMYSVFQLPAGLLADRVGKKRLLVWGLLGMAGSLVVASTARAYPTLVAAQVLAGISGSTYHPTGMSLVSDLETGETEGKAMGVFGFGGMLGTAAAPAAVGGIAAALDWRTALLAAAGGGALVTVGFRALYRPPEGGGRESESGGGSGSGGGDPGGPAGAGPDGGAGAGTGAETSAARGAAARVRERLRRVVQFRVTPGVVVLTAVTLLISLQLRALHTFATGFLVDGVGQPTSAANGAFAALLAASAVASVWVGGLADRFDRARLGAAAAGLTSLLLAATFPLTTVGLPRGLPTTVGLAGAFALLGLVLYGIMPVKNALISEYATADSSGSLFGVTQTASAVGSAVGPALFGTVATAAGIGVAFPLIAAVSLLIAAGFLLLGSVGE
ncbi:MAG: MFS transporter [Haloferacaceae archaeon]